MPKLYKYDIEGGLMNKEQIQVEYLKLLNQKVDDENKIVNVSRYDKHGLLTQDFLEV